MHHAAMQVNDLLSNSGAKIASKRQLATVLVHQGF
jgi:hypothetical protein